MSQRCLAGKRWVRRGGYQHFPKHSSSPTKWGSARCCRQTAPDLEQLRPQEAGNLPLKQQDVRLNWGGVALWGACRHPNNHPFGETALPSVPRRFSWSHHGGAHPAQGSRRVRGRPTAREEGVGEGCNLVEKMEATVRGDATVAPSPWNTLSTCLWNKPPGERSKVY